MDYVIVGFFCAVVGYAIGLCYNVRAMEAEIKLRHQYQDIVKCFLSAVKSK